MAAIVVVCNSTCKTVVYQPAPLWSMIDLYVVRVRFWVDGSMRGGEGNIREGDSGGEGGE